MPQIRFQLGPTGGTQVQYSPRPQLGFRGPIYKGRKGDREQGLGRGGERKEKGTGEGEMGMQEGRGSLGMGKKGGKRSGGDKSPAWSSQDLGRNGSTDQGRPASLASSLALPS